MKLNKHTISAAACAVFTMGLNIYAYFRLPETIITQITLTGNGIRSSTLLYLVFFTSLTVATSVTVLLKNTKKWLPTAVILTLLNIFVIVTNLLKA